MIAKLEVDDAINHISLVKKIVDKDFDNHNKTKINNSTLSTQAVKVSQITTKSYVDQFHQKNERSRRGVRLGFYSEFNEL